MKPLAKLAALATAVAGVVALRRAKAPAEDAEPLPELTAQDRAYVETWVADEIQRLRALSYDQLLQHEGQDFHSEPPSVAKDDFIRAPDGSFIGE